MTITIQPELEQFVQQEIASGEYGDASAVVAEALRLLQQKRRHEALRDEIRIGVEQAERGETAPLERIGFARRFVGALKHAHIQRTRQAETDLIEIADFIARDNPVAAFSTARLLDKRVAMLSRQPLIGEPRDDLAEALRQFTVSGYLIYCPLLEDGVRVVRVLHGARNVHPLFPDRGEARH